MNHDQALTLFPASKIPHELVYFASTIFPDAWALDLDSRELSHLFETGLPPADA